MERWWRGEPDWELRFHTGLTNVYAISAGAGGHGLALSGNGAPVITVQPLAGATVANGMVRLQVLAVGSPPLSYQWQLNGVDIPEANSQVLLIPQVQYTNAGQYRVVVRNAAGTATSREATVYVDDFNQALGTPGWAWSTGGDAPWTTQTLHAHDGQNAAQNSYVPDYSQSWLETTVTVTNASVLRFWWSVSCGMGDFGLAFHTNGAMVGPNIEGGVDWEWREVYLPAGTHALRWTYYNAAHGDEGSYGWLDQVSLTPVSAILSVGHQANPGQFSFLGRRRIRPNTWGLKLPLT